MAADLTGGTCFLTQKKDGGDLVWSVSFGCPSLNIIEHFEYKIPFVNLDEVVSEFRREVGNCVLQHAEGTVVDVDGMNFNLKTASSVFSDRILGEKLLENLFKFAQQCTNITITCKEHGIPWELLFCGGIIEGSFLCENTIVGRWIPSLGADYNIKEEASYSSWIGIGICSKIFCDFVEHVGSPVDIEKIDKIDKFRDILPLGENSRTNIFVGPSDASNIKMGSTQMSYDALKKIAFGSESLLIWITCYDDSRFIDDGNIASYSAHSDQRTVIAPNIILPYKFAGKLIEAIVGADKSGKRLRLFDFMESLRTAMSDRSGVDDTWKDAFLIYPFLTYFGDPCVPIWKKEDE